MAKETKNEDIVGLFAPKVDLQFDGVILSTGGQPISISLSRALKDKALKHFKPVNADAGTIVELWLKKYSDMEKFTSKSDRNAKPKTVQVGANSSDNDDDQNAPSNSPSGLEQQLRVANMLNDKQNSASQLPNQ